MPDTLSAHPSAQPPTPTTLAMKTKNTQKQNIKKGCGTLPDTLFAAHPTTNTDINGRQPALVTKLKTSKIYSYNMNEFEQHISNLEICQRVIALP